MEIMEYTVASQVLTAIREVYRSCSIPETGLPLHKDLPDFTLICVICVLCIQVSLVLIFCTTLQARIQSSL